MFLKRPMSVSYETDRWCFDKYCAVHSDEFGGAFSDGEHLFGALFTGHLAVHKAALRVLLSRPELVSIRAADRSLVEVQAASRRLGERLMAGRDRHGAVVGVSPSLHEGQFLPFVYVSDCSPEVAAEITARAHPEAIKVFCARGKRRTMA